MIRKYHNHTTQTKPSHHEEESKTFNSKNTSLRQLKQSNKLSLFLFKMNAKLEKTQSNAQQNQDKHRTQQPMGSTSNNGSTSTEPPP